MPTGPNNIISRQAIYLCNNGHDFAPTRLGWYGAGWLISHPWALHSSPEVVYSMTLYHSPCSRRADVTLPLLQNPRHCPLWEGDPSPCPTRRSQSSNTDLGPQLRHILLWHHCVPPQTFQEALEKGVHYTPKSFCHYVKIYLQQNKIKLYIYMYTLSSLYWYHSNIRRQVVELNFQML